MIDLSNFNKQSGKVSHNLINSWSWDDIANFKENSIRDNVRYYQHLGNGGYTIGGVENSCLTVKEVLEFLHPLLPTFHARAGMYVSENAESKTFPLHNDPGQHLWIWQIMGNTLWQVENHYMNLQEGELLYILPGVYHRAIPNSPRASITFSLEEFD